MKPRAGQALVEYVLIIALLAVTLIGIMLLVGGAIGDRLVAGTNSIAECATPGQGGGNPGYGDGTAPGQCKKTQ